jgi:hypothetical protein
LNKVTLKVCKYVDDSNFYKNTLLEADKFYKVLKETNADIYEIDFDGLAYLQGYFFNESIGKFMKEGHNCEFINVDKLDNGYLDVLLYRLFPERYEK